MIVSRANFGMMTALAVAMTCTAVSPAHAQQATTRGDCSQAIIAGRDVSVICGYTATQVAQLVRAAGEGATAPLRREVQELRGRLGVSEGAALAMLRTLGQADIPPEQLPRALAELTLRHQELLARLRSTLPTGSVRRILWVDDNPRNNEFERQAFGDQGVEFGIATSTSEALRLLAKFEFDAIISDMGRPPDLRAGYTLLDAIRRNGSSVPFFIYAGSRDPRHQAETLERGGQGTTNLASELVAMVLTQLTTPAASGTRR